MKTKKQYETVIDEATRLDHMAINLEHTKRLIASKTILPLTNKETEKRKLKILLEMPSFTALKTLGYPESIYDLNGKQLFEYRLSITVLEAKYSYLLSRQREILLEMREKRSLLMKKK